MEKECLTLLLRGKQPVAAKHRRVVAKLAAIRNEFVAALADEVFIAYASAGSKTEQLCRKVLAWGKPVLTLDDPRNDPLITIGASPIQPHHTAWKKRL